MGIVLKVVAIVLAVVIAVGIIGTLIGVGIGVVRYMANQNFDFGTAISWSWDEYMEWLQKVNPIKVSNAEDVIVYEMTNKNINVVPCINL